VRALYKSKGYEDAAVDVRATPQGPGRVDVSIDVREGSRIKIGRVVFTGNKAFPSGTLRDVITTRAAGLFDFLTGGIPHDETRLDHDRELIALYYADHGYPDVKVERARSERDQAGAWTISFAIDEGERYRFGKVTIEPEPGVPAVTGLQRHLKMRTGDVWSRKGVQSTVEAMTEDLVAAGKVDLEVVAIPDRDPKTRSIGVAFKLRKRPKIVIERIAISGNSKTKDEVVRRELRFAEGDIYHPALVAAAKKRLMRLGFFKSVQIAAVKGSRAGSGVIKVQVVEQPTLDVGFGIGYSTTEGVTGDISLTERNLLGNGQYVKVKLAASELRREIELGFTEPYFLGRRLAAGFDVFYRDLDSTAQSSYKSERAGGKLRLGFELSPNVSTVLNYTFTRTTIYDVGAGASTAIKQAVPGYPDASSGSYDTSSVGYTVAYDTRDNVRNPMQGLYIATTQDLAGLGGDSHYLRTVVEARGYMPVGEKAVLATRAIGGTITGIGESVRLLDNFYRGGETIRGFATAGIGPRDIISTNKDALGGVNYMATSAELRFPFPFVSQDIGLRGALFADAGSLWGLSGSTGSTPGVVGTSAALRASVGAGLIWDSPLGPLRVDYAQALIKQPFDKTQPLRFGLGPGF
ncbi:MAG: outer membrane protein assembly factor BamA, partial [Hyphomicrobiaceae bacterium]